MPESGWVRIYQGTESDVRTLYRPGYECLLCLSLAKKGYGQIGEEAWLYDMLMRRKNEQ